MVLKKSLQAGVTLIEMLIVVAIIAVVSAVLMFNYSDFSTNVSLRNLSQEMALAIRKTQTYATSVRAIDGTDFVSSSSFPGYGIAFSVADAQTTPSPIHPSSKRFVLFADISDGLTLSDHQYGADVISNRCGTPSSSSNECIETFDISTADKIVAICGEPRVYDAEIESCTGTSPTDNVSITFRRPSPDAYILYNGQPSSYAQIVIQSPKDLKRQIIVWNTGQITTQ